MKLTILRPGPIYDAVGLFRKHQGLLYRMADLAEKGDNITIYGTNDAVRNYIHVDDLVEVMVRTINGGHAGTFSCLHPQNVAVSKMADAAIAAFSSKSKIVWAKDKESIPDTLFPADDRLYQLIDYRPQIDMAQGMRKIAMARQGGMA